MEVHCSTIKKIHLYRDVHAYKNNIILMKYYTQDPRKNLVSRFKLT